MDGSERMPGWNETLSFNETLNVSRMLCAVNEPYNQLRFTAIMVMTCTAICGIFTNLLLMYIFLKISNVFKHSTSGRKSSRVYVTCLALMDSYVCVSYVFLMGFDAIAVYCENVFVYTLYNDYVLLVFITSRMTAITIPYFIIVATLERWLFASRHHRRRFFRQLTRPGTRFGVVVFIIVAGVLLRAPMIPVYESAYYPECPDPIRQRAVDFTKYGVMPFFQFMNFFLPSIVYVIAPFLILIALNIATIASLKRNDRHPHTSLIIDSKLDRTASYLTSKTDNSVRTATQPSTNGKTMSALQLTTTTRGQDMSRDAALRLDDSVVQPSFDSADAADLKQMSNIHSFRVKHNDVPLDVLTQEFRKAHEGKRRVREATNTVVVVVASYLLCSCPNFGLTVLETFSRVTLMDGDDYGLFYMISSDVTSALFMICSFLRIFINAACNHEVRQQLIALVRAPKRYRPLLRHTRTDVNANGVLTQC